MRFWYLRTLRLLFPLETGVVDAFELRFPPLTPEEVCRLPLLIRHIYRQRGLWVYRQLTGRELSEVKREWKARR